MRKAVAVALVLIAGAAVVLWFGNRLNSWVLGGLIGGLASLLLSIPISWTLFSYFARQHEEQRQYTQAPSRRVRSHRSAPFPGYLPQQLEPGYHDDEDALDDDYLAHEVEGDIYTVVEETRQSPTTRRKSGWLDEEFGHTPVPPERQLPPSASSRHAAGNASPRYLPDPYGSQQQRMTPAARQSAEREEENRESRIAPRRAISPGMPGQQPDPSRSRFRSEALRTARLEAVRQYMEENDAFPTQIPIHDENSPSTRGKQSFRREMHDTMSYDRSIRPTPRATPRPSRPDRRTIDSLPPFNRSERESLPAYTDEVEEPYTDLPTRSRRGRKLQTNHLIPDSSSGDIRRPLLRRAPYSYADDEVRQEMLRYSEEPPVRRSSRYLRRRKDEDQTQ